LPLSTGVVLPGMVVTLTLESPEAAAAVKAALRRRRPPAGPRSEDGHYARVGTVAHIEEMGRTPGGTTALVIRGLHRAIIGSGIAGTGDATWVQIDPQPDQTEGLSPRTHELAREYRATVENIL